MERKIPKREPKVFDKEMRHEVIKHPQKFVRYKEGCEIYPISQKAFERLAWDAGAVYKVGKMCLVNLDIFDEYLESFRMTEKEQRGAYYDYV